jgi:hypothetical protein
MVESVTTYELRCIIGRAPFRLAKNNHISLLTSTCRCYGIRHTKWSLKVDRYADSTLVCRVTLWRSTSDLSHRARPLRVHAADRS